VRDARHCDVTCVADTDLLSGLQTETASIDPPALSLCPSVQRSQLAPSTAAVVDIFNRSTLLQHPDCQRLNNVPHYAVYMSWYVSVFDMHSDSVAGMSLNNTCIALLA